MKIILILLLFCNTSFAAPGDIPTVIVKGAPSPIDGYVITPQFEQKTRTALTFDDLMIDNLQKQNDKQKDMLTIDAQQIKLYQDLSSNNRELTILEKAGYFALGAILTGLVSYAAVKATK
jgi:hypothetical protein